ncbi:MAG: hypothetical protein C4575_12770 [Desulforudis sp.]|nr:MAG: hypothetical protein C4575_12770 [Desulforudis sp.]
MENSFETKTGIKTLLMASQPTLLQAVETFLQVGLAGRSPRTVEWYRKHLVPLAHDLGEEMTVGMVMEADLLDWYARLERRQVRWEGSSRPTAKGRLAPDTLHGYVRAVRLLFKRLMQWGVILENPAAHLELPKLPRSGRPGISDSNVQAILHAAKDDIRDYALLRFLEASGCRRGGIANLQLGDLNLDNDNERLRRRATVHEKGAKERSVVLTPGALQALEAWLELRSKLEIDSPDDDHVFLGREHQGMPWRPMREDGISGVLRRYKERLDLRGSCSPHQWRHRWARKRLQEGMGLSQVSQLMGHEDVSITVRYYGQFTIDQLQDAYDRFVSDPKE